MIEIPKRYSLVAQTADILRRDLRKGVFGGKMPGEYALCDRFQISRPTLRAALDILLKDGLIEGGRGQRRRVTGATFKTVPSQRPRVVGFLSPLAYHDLSSFSHFLFHQLERRLHDAGHDLEMRVGPRFAVVAPARTLRALLAASRARCWVLNGTTAEVVRWFSEQRIPSLLVGSIQKEILLPCLGVDYRAVCRHAVGILRGRGHCRLALILPGRRRGEAVDMEDGFSEGASSVGSRPSPAWTRLVYHDGTVAGVRAQLNALFRAGKPPTGLLVARPKHVLTVMTHLLFMGIHPPREVSLISLGYEPFLKEVSPSIAHYAINWNAFANRLARMTLRMAETGVLDSREIRVMPRFVNGETLGPGRNAP